MARPIVKPHWNRLVYVHRLMHISNIPRLLETGFVHSNSEKADSNYIVIGDRSIIKVRDQEVHHGYRLSDYIPFYLGPRTPMLLVIQSGRNGVDRHDAEDIVYCAVRISTIIEQDWDCIFTDGHAVSGITKFYDKSQLPHINDILSVEDVYAKYWIDDVDTDLNRRKQAELLVRDEIPAQFISGFFVYNERAKQRLETMGVDFSKICVAPEYYF